MNENKLLLQNEIRKRLGEDQSARQRIRSLLSKQNQELNLDPELRVSTNPLISLVNSRTGSNLQGTKDPESISDTLKKNIYSNIQAPKAGGLEALKMGLHSNGVSDFKREQNLQRQRESLMKSKLGEKVINNRDLINSINHYKGLLNRFGTGNITGVQRAMIENAHKEVQMAYKTAAELGAITGPDMQILNGIIPDVNTLGGTAASLYKGGLEGAMAGLNQMVQLRNAENERTSRLVQDIYPALKDDAYMSNLTGRTQEPKEISYDADLSKFSLEELKAMRDGR